jgi:hypothetical protein
LKPWQKQTVLPAERLGAISLFQSGGWAGSASSISSTSARRVASPIETAAKPSASACFRLDDSLSGRVPTITVTPLSRALAAWARPWMP